MLILLEGKKEIAEAQSKLEATLKREWKKRVEVTSIGHPGGQIKHPTVISNGIFWYWAGQSDEPDKNPRYLNWFGELDGDGSQNITVETNMPISGIDRRIAGGFARDSSTQKIYLTHSGKIGGGHTGVGKDAFLSWLNPRQHEVKDSDGKIRQHILLMPIEGMHASRSLVWYLENVVQFKHRVRNNPDFRIEPKTSADPFGDYFDEASGKISGTRKSEIDYVSRHGEVVSALKSARESINLDEGRIVKDQYIDLGVAVGKKLIELYEVKTSCDPQCIYTAVGQLEIHGTRDTLQKVLVVPGGQDFSPKLKKRLSELSIKTLRFELGATVKFLDDLKKII